MRRLAMLVTLGAAAALGADAEAAKPLRSSYYMDGRIYVNELGTPEGKPITAPPGKGQEDFKPSWSKTGNRLVFFRRLKNDPVVVKWKTAIHIINADGTGLHPLSDGTHTDFNPTWTRDGTNTPIWNRKNPDKGSFYVMQGKVGGRPGQEIALTDKSYHTWAYSTLTDGRILVACAHPTQGWGYYLMTRNPGGKPRFERIQCEIGKLGLLDRISISPSETKVCFEHQIGFKHTPPGRALFTADFDVKKRAMTNFKAFANEDRKPFWIAYPRWIAGEERIVYHSYETGKGCLYVYNVKHGTTMKVSRNQHGNYRYPHGEGQPK
ncbi:MAG: TolB family protein [Planctomycetota bacterium]